MNKTLFRLVLVGMFLLGLTACSKSTPAPKDDTAAKAPVAGGTTFAAKPVTTPNAMAKTPAAHEKLSKEQVTAVQKALNEKGAKLKVDGKMGPGTKKAIEAFQKEHGLKVTGKADKETMTKLGIS